MFAEFSSDVMFGDDCGDVFGDIFEYSHTSPREVETSDFVVGPNVFVVSKKRLEQLRKEKQVDVGLISSYSTVPAYEQIMDRSKFTGDWFELRILDKEGKDYDGFNYLNPSMIEAKRYQTKDRFYTLLTQTGYSIFITGNYTDWQTTLSLEQLVYLYFDGQRMDTIQVFEDRIEVTGSFEQHTFRKDSLFLKCFASIMCVVSSLPRNLKLELEVGDAAPNAKFIEYLHHQYGVNLSKYSTMIPSTLQRALWGNQKSLLDCYEGIGDSVLDLYFYERFVSPNPYGRARYIELKNGFLSNKNFMLNFVKLGWNRFFPVVSKIKEYANMMEIVIGMVYEAVNRNMKQLTAFLDKLELQQYVCNSHPASIHLPGLILSVALERESTMVASERDIVMLSQEGFHVCTLKDVLIPLYRYEYHREGHYVPVYHKFCNQTKEEVFEHIYDATVDHFQSNKEIGDRGGKIDRFINAAKNYVPTGFGNWKRKPDGSENNYAEAMDSFGHFSRNSREMENLAFTVGKEWESDLSDTSCDEIVYSDSERETAVVSDEIEEILPDYSESVMVYDKVDDHSGMFRYGDNKKYDTDAIVLSSDLKRISQITGLKPPEGAFWIIDEAESIGVDYSVHLWFNEQFLSTGKGSCMEAGHHDIAITAIPKFWAKVEATYKKKKVVVYATHAKTKKRAKLVAVTMFKRYTMLDS